MGISLVLTSSSCHLRSAVYDGDDDDGNVLVLSCLHSSVLSDLPRAQIAVNEDLGRRACQLSSARTVTVCRLIAS